VKVGDLVKRCSTGKIDLVIDVILGSAPDGATESTGRFTDPSNQWLRTADNHDQLIYASNYKLISES
jgi:hypothetical protein